MSTACALTPCAKPARARGYCGMHYARLRRTGSLGPAEEVRSTASPEDRFWPKVDRRDPDACWLWRGAKQKRGYGTFSADGRSVLAHRFAYELLIGPIPDGTELDHTCRVTSCVNPAHVEPVPHRTNVARGVAGAVNGARQRSLVRCIHGHAYTPENTCINRHGYRSCRTCRREAGARYETKRERR